MTQRLLLLGLLVLSAAALAVRFWPSSPPQPAAVATAAPPAASSAQPAKPATSPAPSGPSAPALPPLPQVNVAAVPEHVPPPDAGPREPSSWDDDAAPAHPTRVVPAWKAEAAMTLPGQFSGRAQVTGATSLRVDDKPVRLYGIRGSQPGDRCGRADCGRAAMLALSTSLGEDGIVSCRTPTGARGTDRAICIDGRGADLAGLLVGDGLAHADTSQTYDYVGAETIARDLRRGMWARR